MASSNMNESAAGKPGPPILVEDSVLFQKPSVNVGQKRIMWVDHLPIFGKNGTISSLQFHISGTGSQYCGLSNSVLYLKTKIIDSHGNVFKQSRSQYAIPVDNVLHSLWSGCDVKLNQALVSTSGNNYMYKAYIENLLNFNANSKEYQLSLQGFTGDGSYFDGFLTPPLSAGLAARYKWWKAIETKYFGNRMQNSNTDDETSGSPQNLDPYEIWEDPDSVEFIGPLMADICNQPREILNGVDIDIKLVPNLDDFRLTIYPDGTEAHVVIENAVLKVQKVTMTDSILLANTSMLSKTPALYPLSRTEIRTFQLLQGRTQFVEEDLFQGEVPSRVIIGLVKSEAFAGSPKLNPFRFSDFGIANAAFYVDGESVPQPPLEFDFHKGVYLEGLQSLYKVAGKWTENTDLGISRESYRQGNALIGFEVDPTSSPNFTYVGLPKFGRTRLIVRFHKALISSLQLIIYATFPDTLLIDETRLVAVEEKLKTIQRVQARYQG